MITRDEAKKKICPLMTTGFAADTERLRQEGVIYVQCDPSCCMLWSPVDENNGNCSLTLFTAIHKNK